MKASSVVSSCKAIGCQLLISTALVDRVWNTNVRNIAVLGPRDFHSVRLLNLEFLLDDNCFIGVRSNLVLLNRCVNIPSISMGFSVRSSLKSHEPSLRCLSEQVRKLTVFVLVEYPILSHMCASPGWEAEKFSWHPSSLPRLVRSSSSVWAVSVGTLVWVGCNNSIHCSNAPPVCNSIPQRAWSNHWGKAQRNHSVSC
jgi:hypothetical protein